MDVFYNKHIQKVLLNFKSKIVVIVSLVSCLKKGLWIFLEMNISGNFCFLSAFILFSGRFLHSYPILLGFFKAFFSQNMDQTLKNFVNAIAHILDIAVLRKFGHILEEYGGILL